MKNKTTFYSTTKSHLSKKEVFKFLQRFLKIFN